MSSPNYFDIEVKFLISDIAKVKHNFEQIIRDVDIDKHYRWKRFKEAPSCLKNQESSLPDFIDVHDICDRWYRHETVSAQDFIEYLYGVFDNGEGTTAAGIEKINETKEKFMQANIGSFVYDW